MKAALESRGAEASRPQSADAVVIGRQRAFLFTERGGVQSASDLNHLRRWRMRYEDLCVAAALGRMERRRLTARAKPERASSQVERCLLNELEGRLVTVVASLEKTEKWLPPATRRRAQARAEERVQTIAAEVKSELATKNELAEGQQAPGAILESTRRPGPRTRRRPALAGVNAATGWAIGTLVALAVAFALIWSGLSGGENAPLGAVVSEAAAPEPRAGISADRTRNYAQDAHGAESHSSGAHGAESHAQGAQGGDNVRTESLGTAVEAGEGGPLAAISDPAPGPADADPPPAPVSDPAPAPSPDLGPVISDDPVPDPSPTDTISGVVEDVDDAANHVLPDLA